MQIIRYILAAFSMFSVVPVRCELKKEDFKYTGVFLPLIGLTMGAGLFLCLAVFKHLGINNFLRSLLITIFPVAFTGGIHLDGYMDCNDAFASHASKERMLEIMKDSSIGAFACLHMATYLLCFFVFSLILPKDEISFLMLVILFSLSRTTASYSLLTLKGARSSGMGKSLKELADIKKSKDILIFELVLLIILALVIDMRASIGMLTFLFIAYIYCTGKIKRLFGGITGDLAGWMLSLSELLMLLGLNIARGGIF